MADSGSWRDEPRSTVQVTGEQGSKNLVLRGTPSFDRNRANLFCRWEPEEGEDDPLWGPRGSYVEAGRDDPARLEVEVRFAFNAVEDAEEHAEVYVWQLYRWELVDGKAVCTTDEHFGGEYVVEAGGLSGPERIFQPVVAAAVEHLRSASESNKTQPCQVLNG